ncbi:MAG: amidohydrolase [Bacteroidota bacterium]
MEMELKVALVQSHLIWENPEANRERFAEKIDGITNEVDLIVLPEMFTTGFTMKPNEIDTSEGERTLQWMEDCASKKNTALCGSLVFNEKNHYFNRLFFVLPEGEHFHYDKKHTFTLAGENKVYKAGNKKVVFEYKGFRICPLICYDLRFPVWARNREDYDILIYVANWPKPRINAWDALLKARAIENMAYCIGVNRIGLDGMGHEYPGHSAVYDVLGNGLGYTEREEVIYATLSKEHVENYRTKLRFLADRDAFNLI